jgi:outer membrane receptor protein involved in Fe transport
MHFTSRSRVFRRLAIGASLLTPLAMSGIAHAEDIKADPADIIVTAQKRSQSINSVGMSIAAFNADQLKSQGVSTIADLAKVVPGLTAQQTPFGAPAYSLRGVGFYESSLGAAPAVSTYIDQVSIPYASLSRLVAFDLERVEVLKGPQGTLYGQNATGGAINFIAAKPKDHFESGLDLGYGRFETFDATGYVSGPIGNNLKARIALKTVHSGPWQKSYTRDDTLGRTNQLMGRALVEWTPTEALTVSLALNAWRDRSDTEAGQLTAITPQVPAGLDPRIAAYPLSPLNPRAADWTPNRNLKRNDRYEQYSGRIDYRLSDALSLTSITAYQRYRSRVGRDGDAIALQDSDIDGTGRVDSFSQEVRLAGEMPRLHWILGGNYSHDKIFDDFVLDFTNSSNSTIPPFPKFNFAEAYSHQLVRAYGIFANAEYEVVPDVTLLGGIRYNNTKNRFVGGNKDVDGKIAPFFNFLSQALCGCNTNIAIVQGGDYLLIPSNHYQAGPVFDNLNEDNISYHAGVNWKPNSNALLYVNISKGYKAGSFPTQSGASASQLLPAVQESVMAYEAGTKLTFADRKVQVNLAIFQYDYKNKQVRAKALDPIFGVVEKLINVPKSRIRGIEAQMMVAPLGGLTFNLSGNYLDAKVTEFPNNIDEFGNVQDAAGTRLPYTPKWQGNADAQYEFRLNDDMHAFAGASLTYNSSTNGGVGAPALTAIGAYTLLDLRAGLKSANDVWRLTFWGKNVANKYYWTNVIRVNDTTFRYAGRPATYGVTLSMKFR